MRTEMVNLMMAIDDDDVHSDINEDGKSNTKKSLRLSRKNQLILKRKREEIEKREKEEKQKVVNEKEEDNAVEIDEFESDSKAKQKRHWESWAKADKDLFFEAISEFGKDFDKICSYMDRKAKTRSKSVKDSEPRNKDQIRYFYYRTWKQISKAVSLQPCESKRIQHEIYCLICYGELRKKCRGFGNKDLKKLDELVSTGSTTVRFKGRKIRIKPPTCRFLKKLSDDDDKSNRDQESIPESIDVELLPRSNKTWTMAQSLAYNPRIRLCGLPITLKIRSLIKLLQRRFCPDALNANDLLIQLLPPKDVNLNKASGNRAPLIGTSVTELIADSSQGVLVDKSNDNSVGCFTDNRQMRVIEADQLEGNAATSSSPARCQTPTVNSNVSVQDNAGKEKGIVPANPGVKDNGILVASPAANVSTDVVTPLLGGNVIQSFSTTPLLSSPSANITSCSDVSNPPLEEPKHNAAPNEFFPITQANCVDKDLQACYLMLNRPGIIRLEYELEKKVDKLNESSNGSFEKLISLAQRDLCKALKLPTQPTKATSTVLKIGNQVAKIIDPLKSIQPSRSSVSSVNISGISTSSVSKPVAIGSTKTSPTTALKNVKMLPSTTIVQRKVVPRPRPIQPASKTLMSKAVAVNIVPQPARLVQFGQLPPVSAQLINSGVPSLSSTSIVTFPENPPQIPVTGTTFSGTAFSAPSTSALSTKLTIWGCATAGKDVSDNVQVEVIQEGSRTKAPVKRLHPTSVTTAMKPAKIPCIESPDKSKHRADLNEFDLSFLGTSENSRPKNDNQIATDSINLSSILSRLTKNLCKNGNTETSNSLAIVSSTVTKGNTEVTYTVAPTNETTTAQQVNTSNFLSVSSTESSSVLTTPVKLLPKTPSKTDQSTESVRMQPLNFEHQWFGGDVSEFSLGGILDVANLKDASKNSDSTQGSEVSVSKYFNDGEKNTKATSPTPSQGTDVSLGTILGTLEKKNDNSKESVSQHPELLIGKLLGEVQKEEKTTNNQTSQVEPVKTFTADSLLMKPDADPVTVFESLMDENSVDYINKFKDLTSRLKANDASTKVLVSNVAQAVVSSVVPDAVVPDGVPTANVKDPKLPIYNSEDSVGLLDDLSFVLPTNDSNSTDFSKAFS